MPGYYLSNSLLLLYNKDKGICHICNKFVPIHEATREHIVPRALIKKGHKVEKDNVALAHKRCNNEKGDTYDVVYSRTRTTSDPNVHTHSKKSGGVPDSEYDSAIKHEEIIRKAVKSSGGGTVLGTANKNWRCLTCGAKNFSEEVSINANTGEKPEDKILRKIKFCWHCETPNINEFKLQDGKWRLSS